MTIDIITEAGFSYMNYHANDKPTWSRQIIGFDEIKQLIQTTKVIPKDLDIYTFCPAFSSKVVITCNNDLALSQFKLDEISCLKQNTQIVSWLCFILWYTF